MSTQLDYYSIKKIAKYLGGDDIKNISLISKECRTIAYKSLWFDYIKLRENDALDDIEFCKKIKSLHNIDSFYGIENFANLLDMDFLDNPSCSKFIINGLSDEYDEYYGCSQGFCEHLIDDFKKIPNTVKSMDFEGFSAFDGDPILLPRNLVYLRLGKWFDSPIDNLPQTLKILIFGKTFNQPINNLPPNLEILELGAEFGDYGFENLPKSLTKIYDGWDWYIGDDIQKLVNPEENSYDDDTSLELSLSDDE